MIENKEKEIHELCCKHMTVVKMEKDQVVMEEGTSVYFKLQFELRTFVMEIK